MSEDIKFEKRVNFSDIEDAVRDSAQNEVTVDFNGVEIRVLKTVGLTQLMQMTKYVSGICFDGDTGEYLPELRDFAIRSSVVMWYTDIELPDDVFEQYDILYASPLFDCILESIDESQFLEFVAAVEKKLEYIASISVDSSRKKLDEIVNTFSELSSLLEDLFGGISSDEINNIAEAISNGAFDENKLVEAIVNNNNGN